MSERASTSQDVPVAAARDLEGQVVVVTGASRGIGRAVARRLAGLGASVVVNWSRDETGAAWTVNAVTAAGGVAHAIQADVSRASEVQALFDQASCLFGRVDIVIANAGIDETGGPLLDVTEDDDDRMFGVNAKGAFLTLQQGCRASPDGGRVLYIGSSTTLCPVPGFGLYGARSPLVSTSSVSWPTRSVHGGSR